MTSSKEIDFRILVKAIENAFDVNDLHDLIDFDLKMSPGQFIAQNATPSSVARALVEDARKRGEIKKLLEAIYEQRPNNPDVKSFYQSYYSLIPGSSTPNLPNVDELKQKSDDVTKLFGQMVDLLLRVPDTASFNTRTALLSGIPSLARDQTNARTDFVSIINQLRELYGNNFSREHGLLTLIDNAILYTTEETPLGQELLSLKARLK
ncbi:MULTISPECIES: effector-associated domain EAD1-containing protein [unclassified Nostoc]|uniref:effector-associated domain EAD1-containing protein n=1 Tax=unclassified Nostoc TaxID=2593658 RepID=UPI0013D83355|nr:effector-associated domain EAD1-containing protein [Nostoc sp. UIC 10630]NEU79533.1 hypothetical protein [Nostoc sp. UIC 10630]